MKIAIIGGGNIGTLMAAEFAFRGHDVKIYSRRPADWSDAIEVYDADDNFLFCSSNITVCSELVETICDAELIWITTPASTFNEFASRLEPIVNKRQILCVVPGLGGAEFAFYKLIKKGIMLLGMQRVHSIARLKKYGHSVYMLGRKDNLHIATIPASEARRYQEVIENLFSITTMTLPNYLNITLTPSNPILHTTRLYSLFHAKQVDYEYTDNPLFYESWDEESSEIMLKCDNELINICSKIPLDISGVKPLSIYYESDNVEAMTSKISSIKAFKGLLSPMYKSENGWKIDWNSRYFTTDFSFGLKILIDIAKMFEIKTPEMNKVWEWYSSIGIMESVFQMPVDKEQFIKCYR